MKTDSSTLTKAEQRVLLHAGTERPSTGLYTNHKVPGVYRCKQCGQALYLSEDKFDSHCGWPSFDDEIDGAVTHRRDPDGRRTEIVCSACQAHLGHVFEGEQLTDKNVRHCVNSISMTFTPALPAETAKATFASGCFWGTEYHLQRIPGVLSTTVGYTGGTVANPTYKQVCQGTTGHAEAVEVLYDPSKVTYNELAKVFFETHDPTQVNRQGPDIGTQYRSEVFVHDEAQKEVIEELVRMLTKKGLKVATRITPSAPFYPAETYHQDYYERNAGTPYCHVRRKLFD